MVAKQIVIEDSYFKEYNKEPDNNISRSKSMKIFMDRVKNEYPSIDVIKSKKSEGGDIIFSVNNTQIKANFYHSKTYKTFYPSGWHVLDSKDLEKSDVDIYVFNLKYYEDIYTYIFTKEEIKEYVKDKKKDNSGNYHFNFEFKNNKMLETRDYIKDVSTYYNRLFIINNLIKRK